VSAEHRKPRESVLEEFLQDAKTRAQSRTTVARVDEPGAKRRIKRAQE
jgi:hypothetical protein